MKIAVEKYRIIILFGLLLLPLATIAQTNISIANVATTDLEFTAPQQAGSPVTNVSDNSKWINYTTVVAPEDPGLTISVSILSGSVPQGMTLCVEAGQYTGAAGGDPGTPAGKITVSYDPQVLISNIGTCDTGTGINAGHQLTYSAEINDVTAFRASQATTVDIIYTITQ